MGTTSEKLTYLNTTKTLIKEELNLGGANISTEPFRAYSSKLKGIYKDFLANGTDTLWNNWEKVSGTGETLTLTPTIKGKMAIDLKGNTQQNGTPTPDTPIDIQVVSGDNTIKVEGKNLLNPVFEKGRLDDGVVGYAEGVSSLTNTNNSITFTTNTSWRGITSDYIEVKSGSYILIRGIVSSGNVHSLTIASYDENKNYIANISNAVQSYGWRAFNNPNAKYIRVCFMMNTSGTTTITNPQVEFGEEPTEYTPYVSQTYPVSLGNIELCKIGTYQDKIAKSTEKNLFSTDYKTSDTFTTYTKVNNNSFSFTCSGTWKGAIFTTPCEKNTDYYLSYKDSSGSTYCQIKGVQTDTTLMNAYNGYFYSFNTGENTSITINIGNGNHSDMTSGTVSNIMLNEGTSALPYEPYGKVWYLNKQIGKVVLNGSENGWSDAGDGKYYIRTISNLIQQSYSNGYSNYFVNVNSWSALSTKNTFALTDFGNDHIYNCVIISTNNSTLNDFKTWLSNNNTEVYYQLATPTYEEITGELLSQLEALAYSYDGTTNISQVNDDMPFVLDITALKEMS